MTIEYSAVARAAARSTICHSCIPARRPAPEPPTCGTSHSAAPSSLQMPIGFLCSARRRLHWIRLRFRRPGRTQRCEVPQHDCAAKSPKTSLFYRSSPPSAAARPAPAAARPPMRRQHADGQSPCCRRSSAVLACTGTECIDDAALEEHLAVGGEQLNGERLPRPRRARIIAP